MVVTRDVPIKLSGKSKSMRKRLTMNEEEEGRRHDVQKFELKIL